jgi:hypothetical protein
MTDPRFTDPRNDPVIRDEPIDGTWGWIAGLAVLALIAFVVIAGWNSNPNTASNGSAPMTTSSSPMRPSPLPSTTTGSGTTSPQPSAPAPSAVPSNSDAK